MIIIFRLGLNLFYHHLNLICSYIQHYNQENSSEYGIKASCNYVSISIPKPSSLHWEASSPSLLRTSNAFIIWCHRMMVKPIYSPVHKTPALTCDISPVEFDQVSNNVEYWENFLYVYWGFEGQIRCFKVEINIQCYQVQIVMSHYWTLSVKLCHNYFFTV